MIAKRIGVLLVTVTLVASGAYVLVYLLFFNNGAAGLGA